MKKRNAENEKARRGHLAYLEGARRRSVASVDKAAVVIDEFDAWNGRTSFKRYHPKQAIAFRRYLEKQTNPRTGKPVSKATTFAKMTALREFFVWLSWQPGYKSRITRTEADYFSVSDGDARIAKARQEPQGPTLNQIRQVLATMPTETAIQRRDRAVVAFTILSGCRVSATISLKLKHIDLARRRVIQDAREVRTKRSKSFVSHFFPVGDDIREIVEAWIEELRTEHLYGPDDPLFPKTAVAPGASHAFEPVGFLHEHWSGAEPVRTIFRCAFAAAGLPYHHPHTFRSTLVQLAYQRRLDPEQMKVWSMNLGHEQMMTTFTSYGQVSLERQGEVMGDLATSKDTRVSSADLLRKLARLAEAEGL